jgi:DNA-binding NarL/FixJ family response regulator
MNRKILVVDDHPLLREGLVHVIEAEPGLSVSAQAGTAAAALREIERDPPDLVLTDISLPDRNGLELIKDLHVLRPEMAILVLSMHDEMIYAERALAAGARGYVMKEAAAESLVEAVRAVLDGRIFTSPEVVAQLVESLAAGGDAHSPSLALKRLTDRELEVFERIGEGRDNREIAAALRISPRTVDAHRAHIREKLGFTDGSALTRYAIRSLEAGPVRRGGA